MTEDSKVGINAAVGEIISSALVPSANTLGIWLNEKFKFILFPDQRQKQAELVVEGAQEILDREGLEPKVFNAKLFHSILENASLENEEELTKKWMGLLASSVIDNSAHPCYPRILSELTSQEARILDLLYKYETQDQDSQEEDKPDIESIIAEPNGKVSISLSWLNISLSSLNEVLGYPPEQFQLSIDNLLRTLLCVHPEHYEKRRIESISSFAPIKVLEHSRAVPLGTQNSVRLHYSNREFIKLSTLGLNFLKACYGPKAD